MKRVNQYVFYQLGSIVHPILTVEEGQSLPQSVWELNKARAWVEFVLDNQLFRIVVCQKTAQKLVEAIDAVVPRKTSEFSAIDAKRELTWYEAYNIRTAASEFETVFAAELATFDTYIVSKKGIYSTADLIDRADMAFDENAHTSLSAEVLSDFQQAGRCLAFELATAAGFHTMRAVEAVVRSYWRLALKKGIQVKSPDMAVCINELRKAQESEKLMNILDDIRDLHRNTIMHPEAFLDMKDALRLFDVAKSAISAMADRIGELEEDARVEAELDAAVQEEADRAAARAAELERSEQESAKPAASSILMLDVPAPAVQADNSSDGESGS